MASVWVPLPRGIVERLRRKAESLGVSLEEYIVERLLCNEEEGDRASGYLEASLESLRRAREALAAGDASTASTRIWSAAILALRAYATLRGENPPPGDGALWRYTSPLARELGEWVADSWAHATAMSLCSHERSCHSWLVEKALESVSRLVEGIARLAGMAVGEEPQDQEAPPG